MTSFMTRWRWTLNIHIHARISLIVLFRLMIHSVTLLDCNPPSNFVNRYINTTNIHHHQPCIASECHIKTTNRMPSFFDRGTITVFTKLVKLSVPWKSRLAFPAPAGVIYPISNSLVSGNEWLQVAVLVQAMCFARGDKKLIRRWDSERELSLRRHRALTTKYNRLVHKFRHRSTRLCVGTHVFTNSAK